MSGPLGPYYGQLILLGLRREGDPEADRQPGLVQK